MLIRCSGLRYASDVRVRGRLMGRSRREVSPSRVLNDQRGVLGLWLSDFAAAVALFMGGSWLLDGTGFELASAVMAVLLLIVLSPLRLTTRRKIVRDQLRRLVTPRVIYDPRKHITA